MANNRSIRIVSDSACDIKKLCGADNFSTAPLKIITSSKEYVDDDSLDLAAMVEDLSNYKGKSSTSCPNISDWIEAFGGADEVYCITITGTLSGSYNSALNAKKAYEEENPGKRVFVIDSLSTGPEMVLIIEKIRDLTKAGESFETVCEKIGAYSKKTGLLFILESMQNLANNGRVSPIVAKMAGLLGIRVVGRASDRGDLEPLSKPRGEKKALDTLIEKMKEHGYRGGKVSIAHCINEAAGRELEKMIKVLFPNACTELHITGGLCGFYAEKGGLLVGYEKG